MLPHRSYVFTALILLMVRPHLAEKSIDSGLVQNSQKRQVANGAQKYCGDRLSKALGDICDGVYNSRFKRTDQDLAVNDFPVIYDFHPFKSLKSAVKMLRYRRRNKRGIYEECCLNSCSRSELRSYCGTG